MPTSGARRRRIARSMQRAQFFPEVQRGAWQPGPAEGGPQHTQNGPPSVASRKYEPSSAIPSLGAPLGSPPPEHHPYLVQRDATPKVGASAVVAHSRCTAGRAAPSRVRVVRTAGAGSSTHAGCASACSASGVARHRRAARDASKRRVVLQPVSRRLCVTGRACCAREGRSSIAPRVALHEELALRGQPWLVIGYCVPRRLAPRRSRRRIRGSG